MAQQIGREDRNAIQENTIDKAQNPKGSYRGNANVGSIQNQYTGVSKQLSRMETAN